MKSIKNAVRNFTRYHKGVIFFSVFLSVFIYGVKIYSYNIGVDTDLWLSGRRFLNHMEIGRFGCVLLKSLWSTGKLNIYAANFFAALFLFLGAVFWCILLESCRLPAGGGGYPKTHNLNLKVEDRDDKIELYEIKVDATNDYNVNLRQKVGTADRDKVVFGRTGGGILHSACSTFPLRSG